MTLYRVALAFKHRANRALMNLSSKEVQFMKTNIIGRQLNVYDDTKEMINERMAKLDRYFSDEGQATVTLSHKRGTATMEITIKAAGTLFRSEVEADSFRSALDKSVDNIERQIRKNKTRLQKRLRDGAFTYDSTYSQTEPEDTGEFIIRTKRFEFTPMSVEEAIMQMDLLGHTFFVFNDAETEETCVVYKRHDGNYGLIAPE